MGLRNPFRIHVDPQTGWLLWSRKWTAQPLGAQHTVGQTKKHPAINLR